jgi:hypothetical protein
MTNCSKATFGGKVPASVCHLFLGDFSLGVEGRRLERRLACRKRRLARLKTLKAVAGHP